MLRDFLLRLVIDLLVDVDCGKAKACGDQPEDVQQPMQGYLIFSPIKAIILRN